MKHYFSPLFLFVFLMKEVVVSKYDLLKGFNTPEENSGNFSSVALAGVLQFNLPDIKFHRLHCPQHCRILNWEGCSPSTNIALIFFNLTI